MKESHDFSWQTPDQLSIYGYHWPADNPIAVICLVHGLGEHCRRYDHMAAYFNAHQISIMGFDRRGHGRSGGKRGHTTGYIAFLDEIETLIRHAEKQYPDLPLFLYGHSMGGNLVLNYTLRHSPDIAGTIASGPWIILKSEPSAALILMGRLMVKIYPSFSQSNGISPSQISSDPKEVAKYANDPLVHDRITSATGLAMLDAAEWLKNYHGENKTPILLMHGTADSIVSPDSCKVMSAGLTEEVEVKMWPGMYHEIHNEPDHQKVFDFTYQWIARLITK